MNSKLIAISVEKIQKYIYQRIDDMTSQGLNDEKTLSSICSASKTIADDILEVVSKKFEINKEDYILEVSGKYIFKKDIEEDVLKRIEKEIFQEVYRKYDGQIFLKYTHFKAEKVDDDIEYIKKAIESLKCPKVKSKIIEENQDIIFNFLELGKIKEGNEEDKIESDSNEREEKIEYKHFVKSLDDLVSDKINTRGKIAVVKADLNNMGKIFEEIKSYNKYDRLSKILEETIKLKKFSEYLNQFNLENKILPFYIEGDDIFFAVQIGSLLNSIILLKVLIKELRERLEIEEIGKEINLTLSIGVTFVDNHQPVRYYRKSVEEELSKMKKIMKSEKKKDKAILGVSVAGVNLFYYDGNKGEGETDGFSKFKEDVERLEYLKISNSYFHNLLQSIEREKDEKAQIRVLLYRLLPENIIGRKGKNELALKYYLLSQVLEKEDKSKEKSPRKLKLEKIKSKLIPKLRLFMLLTDERYSEKKEIDKEKIQKYINEKIMLKIKSDLFNKPVSYLYDNEIEKRESTILKLFIKNSKITKEIKDKNGKTKIKNMWVYKKAPFQTSFFYRIKNIIETEKEKSKKLNKVKTVFENINNTIKNNENRERKDNKKLGNKENTNKIDYKLNFNFDKFKELIEEEIDKTDWLDVLILFYSYTQQKIKYLTVNKKK
ncbi:Cas10/Cmr2 second palm domain-containing protein [Pseudoleptotrichia goodfellowii]|uniref:Cas10/Cmr2 second palm domain-containing protein n=2 Tax=Pseudoleptotrichia goodfellowii TaxID=157692 RepID=D0GMM4_9FUSO|nr:hypothetical protein [Pseudoleptotrichia goodfellowii]EEY34639.1 hypothetical protein HMPREF0554_1508 [Pseudoleptotrichia goodfellowii F0264]BBM36943.1 hypothetical protein JCM16774_1889 [Pseudoleptotrichia goodfellowii]